ncbi:MAG: phosphopantothenoylcysteine decarboxylase/phosphopantothenate--cysteine ligase [Patiriisocius sp.]|jgi:phosphopantothenoylcysteine decarboxylase/phosphopantothenate--cysteine ligase
MLKGKKLIVGVTGSIAAYKSALLVRELVKEGAEVKVVMTESSKDFITPLTLATLSKNPVVDSFIKDKESGVWHNHVDLGLWADAFVIAPASANTLAKMAQGICDSILLGTYLSARCPVIIAPAMDLDMFQHFTTTNNIQTLQKNGIKIIDPGDGELASGLSGKGRMAEPEEIKDFLKIMFGQKKKLKGKKALVSAGPTLERIDPVRFISNHSTGTMGYSIAQSLADHGAEVILVSGPTRLAISDPSINCINVESAAEMMEACDEHFASADITIMTAAVADYTPTDVADKKIKKKDGDLNIPLSRTQDILKSLGSKKKKGQLLIGFALETNDEMINAQRKLQEKNLNFIVLNSLKDAGAGFGKSTNKIKIIDDNNNVTEYQLKSKAEVARDIVEVVIKKIND